MKASIFGFQWHPSKHIPLAELMATLNDNRGQLFKMGRTERLMVIHDGDQAYYGLLLSPKNRATLNILQEQQDGTWASLVQHLEGHEKQMEFNFFYMNKAKCKGLYVGYADSCNVFTLCRYVKKLNKDIAHNRIRLMKEQGAVPKGSMKALLKEHEFNFEIKVSQETWEEIVRRVESLRAVTYAFSRSVYTSSFGEPPGPVESERVTVSFREKIEPSDGVVEWFKRLFRENPTSLDAKMEVEPGTVETIHLMAANREKFGEMDVDEAATLVCMNNIFDEFGTCPVVEQLNHIAEQNSAWLTR